MFKIGDFSRFGRVSVKTLRYYDEIGLLRPSHIDKFTGYRYYSADQFHKLNRILALKDLGLSLDQIAMLIKEDLPAAQLRGMLRLKQVEIQQKLDEEQGRLARVEARLRQIEAEDDMSQHEVIIKKISPILVCSIHAIVPNYSSQGPLWQELDNHLRQHNTRPCGPAMTIYFDTEYREQDVDLEVALPISAAIPPGENISVRELAGWDSVACLIHQGSFDNVSESYTGLLAWIEENGFRIAGPNREIYLHSPMSGPSDLPHDETQLTPPASVTEIQFPVEKV
jgi:effector-binding domain-containing protein